MNWDELNEYYKNNMNQTQQQINNLQNEKQAAINDYEAGYNTQLQQYNDLQQQQQNYIDTWAANQKEQQQKQTDYNIGLIEQNKKEAAEETQKQTQDAYVDYMKQTNQYGGALENLASRGLATQGYAESSKVAMYNTYQNRVATANAALTKANTDYNNQIQQALLNNDAALAETALEQMKQSYQLALSGFEYTSNLYNQRLTYLQNINDTYYNRANDLQALQAGYAGELGKIRQYQDEIAMEREKQRLSQEQWEREFAEEQRQFNTQMGYKYDTSSSSSSSSSRSSSSSSGSGGYTDSSVATNNAGNSTATQKKKDYYFSNGYQPQYINDIKLSNNEGWQASQILTIEDCASLGVKAKQNIWKAGDKYYLWIGNSKEYVDVTSAINKAKKNKAKPGTYTTAKSLL